MLLSVVQVFSPEENPAAFHPNVLVRGLTYCFLYVLNAKVLLWPAELCIEWGGTIPLVQSIGACSLKMQGAE